MGRHARPKMAGLVGLGARLKQLRNEAGISQMELARLIGFNPAHGYKYILRLEKGSVPNPTLRTIAACLEACGATWQQVADALPSTGTVIEKPARRPARAESGPAAPAEPEGSPPEAATAPSPVRRRDSRPLREQLRQQRIERKAEQARHFWQNVKRIEDRVRLLLHSQRILTTSHPRYLAFARSACSLVDSLKGTRSATIEVELSRLAGEAEKSGLDRRILTQIQAACIAEFGAGPDGS